ncbi:Site-specific recombinase XerD [Balnearium lithotrophicum]|uniref:Site-specific recombinase XerD n=1 Tax=Balnearium lithotrophicum TaxID=223788 RepID=A0A521CNS1_9BACT|nr:tyrosine-type recombinase/integrase [Balnearium lithotrophicum]SMO61038.1 Site-specific recombinase XerD [Balnearium lithotrophicum]
MKFNISMRLFQRENGVWYVEFERGKKKSLRTRNKAEAIRIYNKLKREYLKGKLIVLKEGIRVPLSQFTQEYLDWAKNNRSEETFTKARHVLNRFREVVGDLYLSAITKRNVDEYVNHLLECGLSKVTVNVHIRTLKSALSKAVEWEYIKENPMKGYKQLKVQQKPPRFLLPQDIAKVEEVIDREEWLFIFRFLIYTGMRIGEAVRLYWKDVDLERGLITVRKSKNFQTRVIPIHPNLRKELLKRYPAIGKVIPYSRDHIEHRLKEYFRKAGFPELRVHDLRHTFASLMVMSGVDLKTVQELLGHTSYKTTEIYAHLAPQHLQEAIKKLPL